MEYITVPFVDDDFRLFQFHRGGDESDILIETTAGMMRYFIDDVEQASATQFLVDELGNQILGDGSPLIASAVQTDNSYLQSELDTIQFTNQEQLGIFVHANHPPEYLTITPDLEITLEPLPAEAIPQYDYRDSKSPGAAENVDSDYDVVFNDVDPNNWTTGTKFVISYDGVFASSDGPEPLVLRGSFDQTTQANTRDEIIRLLAAIPALNVQGINTSVTDLGTKQFTVKITGKGAGKVLVVLPSVTGGTTLTTTVTQTGTATASSEPAWSYPTYVFHGGLYYQCTGVHRSDDLGSPGVDSGPGDTEPGIGEDWALFWELYNGDGLTKPPTYDWQYPVPPNPAGGNLWVTDKVYVPGGRGFPTVATFHQQRLILAAPKNATSTMWGSRISRYQDFAAGVNADDPFVFALDTSDTPAIKWMQSQLNLMVGTSSGDFNVSAEVSLGPTDISAVKQNNARSHLTRPVAVDTEIFYIEQGLSKLRATRYVRDYTGFQSTDVSLVAEHLLHYGIKRVILTQTPEVLMTMVGTPMADGRTPLVFLSYAKNQEVVAWSVGFTDARIYDACAYFSAITNEDSIYLSVERNGAHFIEKMPYPTRKLVEDSQGKFNLGTSGFVWMDSWQTGNISGNAITGLERLEGMEVGVLLEDAWLEGTHVVTGGLVVLPESVTATNYAVGLVYTGTIKTFERIQGNPAGVGFGRPRKWNTINLRVLDSALPRVNGQLAPDRTPEKLMDVPETIRAGLQDIEMGDLNYGDGSIVITQDRPYPVNILGVFGEFVVGVS
jgi:hypothetical protein